MEWAVGTDADGRISIIRIAGTHRTLEAAAKKYRRLVRAKYSLSQGASIGYEQKLVKALRIRFGIKEPTDESTASRGPDQAQAAQKQDPPTAQS